MLARNAKSLAAAICSEIDEATQQHGIPNPTLVFVGATGGLRGALDSGEVTAKQFALFQENLLAGLPSSSHNTFSVISGEDEATWELGAASVIFGPLVRTLILTLTLNLNLNLNLNPINHFKYLSDMYENDHELLYHYFV